MSTPTKMGFGFMVAEAMRLGRELLEELRLHRQEMEATRRSVALHAPSLPEDEGAGWRSSDE